MDEQSIESIVASTIRSTFGCPDAAITRDTQAEDIDGWDSLSHGILILRLQDVLKTKLQYSELYDLANVGELVDYLSALKGRL